MQSGHSLQHHALGTQPEKDVMSNVILFMVCVVVQVAHICGAAISGDMSDGRCGCTNGEVRDHKGVCHHCRLRWVEVTITLTTGMVNTVNRNTVS